MKKKEGSVYTFDVRFTGKQAKAIEAVAKAKGVSAEAMVRQAVRDALDKANNKTNDKKLENYVLNMLGNRPRTTTVGTPTAQRQALERRVLSSLRKEETPVPVPPRKKTR